MIKKIEENKKKYLDLLLLADEQENMIDEYLDRGEVFVLFEEEIAIAIAVVTDEENGVFEIKNLATRTANQGKGYGKRMVDFLLDYYHGRGKIMQLGTGESKKHLNFYQGRGFVISHRVENFFTLHYDQPIVEDGIVLRDMIYLQKKL